MAEEMQKITEFVESGKFPPGYRPHNFVDLIGKQFGNLTVVKRGPNYLDGCAMYWCSCSCGNPNLVLIRSYDLNHGTRTHCGCKKFDYQKIRKENDAKKRIGLEKINNSGDKMKIVEYIDSNNIVIEFQDKEKHRVSTTYGSFCDGRTKNPYKRIVFGRGYIGQGEYSAANNHRAYYTWRGMLRRCYDVQKDPTYNECEVCEEWLNFQNFAKWYEENYWEDGEQTMQVDKDWIVYGNKIYSPATCEIVPRIINSCIISRPNQSSKTGIVGVFKTKGNRFAVKVQKYGTKTSYKTYDTIQEAMSAYKTEKILYVLELAERYKGKISSRLYEKMIDYENRFNLDYPEYSNIKVNLNAEPTQA